MVGQLHRPRPNRGLVAPTGARAAPQADPERPSGRHPHDLGTGVHSSVRPRGERLRHSVGRRLQRPLGERSTPSARCSADSIWRSNDASPSRDDRHGGEPADRDRHHPPPWRPRVHHLERVRQGGSRRRIERASDRSTPLASRSSIPGLLAMDVDERPVINRGRDAASRRSSTRSRSSSPRPRRLRTVSSSWSRDRSATASARMLTRGEPAKDRSCARVAASHARTRPSAGRRRSLADSRSAPVPRPRRSSSTSPRRSRSSP